MAKHTVKLVVNGVDVTVETDTDSFSVAGVAFKFDAPIMPENTLSANGNIGGQRIRVKFLGPQTRERKINCIQAVRIASGMELADAKDAVENCSVFTIYTERRAEFEAHCADRGLTPTYL